MKKMMIATVDINAPSEKVWRVVADLGAVQAFHPAVPKSWSTSGQQSGLGASRHCDLQPSGCVEERVVEWDEGKSFKLDMYGGTLPILKMLKNFTGEISIEEHGEKTTVSQTLEMELKGGPLIGLFGNALNKPFAKLNEQVLFCLKHYVETGEEITPEVMKRIRSAQHTR